MISFSISAAQLPDKSPDFLDETAAASVTASVYYDQEMTLCLPLSDILLLFLCGFTGPSRLKCSRWQSGKQFMETH